MRALNGAAQALLDRIEAGERIPMVQLVEISTDETLYLTTAGCDIVWDGQTWQRAAITVEQIEDSRGELLSISLVLPAVDEAQMALALTASIEGTSVRIFDAIVNPDTGVVADAMLAWAGTLNVPGIEDGPTAVVVVTAEHRGMSALRAKPSRYTDDQQRRLYPGDTALDVDPSTDAAPLIWPAASFFRQ